MQDIFVPEDMDVWYEGSRTWLVTDRTAEGFLYEEAMLCNQRSAAFLPFQVRYQDNKKYYLFDITGKVSLKAELARSRAGLDQVMQIIRSLINVCDAAQEYLLDTGSLLLDPAFIFLDLSEALSSFVLIPGRQGDFKAGIQELAAQLLAGADHQNQDCVLLVYDFFRLVREPDFCLARMKGFAEAAAADTGTEPAPQQAGLYAAGPALEDAGEKAAQAPAEKNAPDKEKMPAGRVLKSLLAPALFALIMLLILILYMNGKIAELSAFLGLPADARWLAVGLAALSGAALLLLPLIAGRIRTGLKADGTARAKRAHQRAEADEQPLWDADEPVWAEDDATQLLFPPPQTVLHRQNSSGDQDLVISVYPSVIGCGPEADVHLDGMGVSRRHAVIDRDGDRILLFDAGSTNGTFVGGRRLKKDETVCLSEGDEIMVANIRFTYQKLSSGAGFMV